MGIVIFPKILHFDCTKRVMELGVLLGFRIQDRYDAGSFKNGFSTVTPSSSWPDCKPSVSRKLQADDIAAARMRESQKES